MNSKLLFIPFIAIAQKPETAMKFSSKNETLSAEACSYVFLELYYQTNGHSQNSTKRSLTNVSPLLL